jgi:uncharacterized damage-inducible protein DinB
MSTSTAPAAGRLAMAFLGELENEAKVTRNCLTRIPEEKFDWKPHEKSMSMGRLATHVAEMFDWIRGTLTKSELDFAAGDYVPFEAKTNAELVEYFDRTIAEAKELVAKTSDEQFLEPWTLKNGDETYFTMPKVAVMRSFVVNHIIHHRGQLSVYMRLNDIPVPSIYGPSADEAM